MLPLAVCALEQVERRDGEDNTSKVSQILNAVLLPRLQKSDHQDRKSAPGHDWQAALSLHVLQATPTNHSRSSQRV